MQLGLHRILLVARIGWLDPQVDFRFACVTAG
jgi:hypothetical protein